jgi:hypothetical protein
MLPRVYEEKINARIRMNKIFVVPLNCPDQWSDFHEIWPRSGDKNELHAFGPLILLLLRVMFL